MELHDHFGRGHLVLVVEERVREDVEQHRPGPDRHAQGVQEVLGRDVVVPPVRLLAGVAEQRQRGRAVDAAQLPQPQAGRAQHQGQQVGRRAERQPGEVLLRPLPRDDRVGPGRAQEGQLAGRSAAARCASCSTAGRSRGSRARPSAGSRRRAVRGQAASRPPSSASRSSSVTATPRSASSSAAVTPAMPPPITIARTGLPTVRGTPARDGPGGGRAGWSGSLIRLWSPDWQETSQVDTADRLRTHGRGERSITTHRRITLDDRTHAPRSCPRSVWSVPPAQAGHRAGRWPGSGRSDAVIVVRPSAPAAPDPKAGHAQRQEEFATALATELGIDKDKVAAALAKIEAARRADTRRILRRRPSPIRPSATSRT